MSFPEPNSISTNLVSDNIVIFNELARKYADLITNKSVKKKEVFDFLNSLIDTTEDNALNEGIEKKSTKSDEDCFFPLNGKLIR